MKEVDLFRQYAQEAARSSSNATLQLGVTNHFADHLFDFAFDLLRRSGDPILIHDSFSNIY